MKAKEKAKEILETFFKLTHDGSDCNMQNIKIQKENAKKASLYLVSEVIQTFTKDSQVKPFGKGYWYSVKKELENL